MYAHFSISSCIANIYIVYNSCAISCSENIMEMVERYKTGAELVGSWTVEVGDLDEAGEKDFDSDSNTYQTLEIPPFTLRKYNLTFNVFFSFEWFKQRRTGCELCLILTIYSIIISYMS